MPTFEVRNRKTRTVLGRLTVDDPTKILEALSDQTGASIEDIALSLGRNIEEARDALEIEEVPTDLGAVRQRKKEAQSTGLPPRRLYA